MPQHFASLVTHMEKTMQAGGLCTWPARSAASLSREALQMTDVQTHTVTDIKGAVPRGKHPHVPAYSLVFGFSSGEGS